MKLNYKNISASPAAMAFAFACHILSVILSVTATTYWQLYLATFIVALANGTVEAVINPVVATMFSTQKVRWQRFRTP